MEKPKTFAGKVIHKYGKTSFNDYEQPEKFFSEMSTVLRQLNEIPFSAVEDLEKYESNRPVMINIVRKMLKIFRAAGLDPVEEIKKIDKTPFDGLEEDIAIQKAQRRT